MIAKPTNSMLRIGGLLLAGLLCFTGCQSMTRFDPRQTAAPEHLTGTVPEELGQTVDEYRVTLQPEETPITVGKQKFIMRIQNIETREPVTVWTEEVKAVHQVEETGAPVEPVYEQDWITKDAQVRRMTEPGAYEITIDFSKPGVWYMRIMPFANPKLEASRLIYYRINVQEEA